MRLDLLLIRKYPALSRRKARDVIEKGQVSVAGELVREAGRDLILAGAMLDVFPYEPQRRFVNQRSAIGPEPATASL